MKYFIITYTKSHYEITEEQNKRLKELELNDELEIDGCTLKIRNIAEILSESKYFEQYPDKRPEETHNQFEDQYGHLHNQQIRKPTGRARELMKQGFVKQRLEIGKTTEQAEQDFKDFINKYL